MNQSDIQQAQVSPYVAGLTCRCPRCGKGKLYAGFLTLAPRCEACGLDYGFMDSGDGPAIFVIMIAGAIVVTAALITEVKYQPLAYRSVHPGLLRGVRARAEKPASVAIKLLTGQSFGRQSVGCAPWRPPLHHSGKHCPDFVNLAAYGGFLQTKDTAAGTAHRERIAPRQLAQP